MNLRQLQHWLALAETGSFSRAAVKLHMTQSALSRSIQMLEDELGGPLVDRIGKRNELTALGQAVLERARRIVQEASDLKQEATILQRGGLVGLRLGLGSGPGALLMTPWLIHMAHHYPQVKVSVTRGPTESQLKQLRERTLDVLVVDLRRVAPADDLSIGPVFAMPAGMVCRADHPLLQQYPKEVPFEALLDYPIASIPLSVEVTRLMVARYGTQGNPAKLITLQCEEITSLLQTVRQTDAVYLGILGAAEHDLARGDLVELRVDPPLNAHATLGMVTLAGRTEVPDMRVFREFLVNRIRDEHSVHPVNEFAIGKA